MIVYHIIIFIEDIEKYIFNVEINSILIKVANMQKI